MKRSFISLLIVVVIATTMNLGCNRQVFDLKYKFNKAMIKMPDGTCKTVNVSKWRDYENSDQIQIIDDSGKVYLSHSCNIVLMSE